MLIFSYFLHQDQVFTFLACAWIGVAIVSLHWIDFEREYIESQWKRYSFMVIAILAFPCFNMLSELCVLFIVFCMVNANNSMRLKQLEFSG